AALRPWLPANAKPSESAFGSLFTPPRTQDSEATIMITPRSTKRLLSRPRKTKAIWVAGAVLGGVVLVTALFARMPRSTPAPVVKPPDKVEVHSEDANRLVEAARTAIRDQKYEEALAKVDESLKANPDLSDARLLKAQLLIARGVCSSAADELDRY